MKKEKNYALFVTSLFLLLAAGAGAQDYRPGFIVKTNGDSVKGSVVYRNDIYNSKNCEFRNPSGEKWIYGPGQIRAFGYTDGKYFLSKELPGEGTVDIVFALVVVSGSMSLYKFDDVFYAEKGDSIVRLAVKTNRIERNGSEYDQVIKTYAPAMNILLADCNMSADNTELNNFALTRLVKKYNKCKGDHVEALNRNVKWLAVRLSAFALYEYSNPALSYFPLSFNPPHHYTMDQSKSAYGGIGFNFSSPQVNDRISLIVEAWYYPTTFQGHYTGDLNNGASGTSDITYSSKALKIPLGFGYSFRKNSNTVYIKAGTAVYHWLTDPHGTITTTASTGTVGLPPVIHFTLSDWSLGSFWATLGYTHAITGKLGGFLEARWETGTGRGKYDTQTFFDSSYTNYTVVAGLIF